MALRVFRFVTAELLPVSLLTSMMESLSVIKGVARQAVTATTTVVLVTGLLIIAVTRSIDRRRILLTLPMLLVTSNLAVAFTADFTTILIDRVVPGIVLGGFWTVVAATVM